MRRHGMRHRHRLSSVTSCISARLLLWDVCDDTVSLYFQHVNDVVKQGRENWRQLSLIRRDSAVGEQNKLESVVSDRPPGKNPAVSSDVSDLLDSCIGQTVNEVTPLPCPCFFFLI